MFRRYVLWESSCQCGERWHRCIIAALDMLQRQSKASVCGELAMSVFVSSHQSVKAQRRFLAGLMANLMASASPVRYLLCSPDCIDCWRPLQGSQILICQTQACKTFLIA